MTHNPGNALIVSTQRLGQIAGLSCLDVVEAVRIPQCFVLQESQMHSQMGVDWTPDDLLWSGAMVCFGTTRQDRKGKREENRGTATQMPRYSSVLLSWWDAIMLQSGLLKQQDSEQKEHKHACFFLTVLRPRQQQSIITGYQKKSRNLYVTLCRCALLTFLTISPLIMTEL